MRIIICGLLAAASLVWVGTGYADDTSSPLDDNHINIRSMIDPSVTILKTQPVSIILPANATIADKQLLQLIKNNLIADGFVVTSPDKSMWTITATVVDESSMLTYSKLTGFIFKSPSTTTATIEYASITVVICANSDLTTPVWMSSVYALNDFWINNQESIVQAILATYGINFYYRNERPSSIPKDVKENDDQPTVPTIDQIKRCVADPKADGC
ncbi:MAG TPA: hypothetical protein VGH91_07220 [Gammaproteobacteria bacterium]|jgi:hypothetical protein